MINIEAHPNHTEAIVYDSTENILEALVDGISVVDRYVTPESAVKVGSELSAFIPGEDTVGIPLLVENDYSVLMTDKDIILSDSTHRTLAQVRSAFRLAASGAIGSGDPEQFDVSFEVLKYLGGGMDWHTDNYGSYSDEASEPHDVLNGVLTLKGIADYSYKNPNTSIEQVPVRVTPGTLVLTRSGELEDLPQVEHKVSAPVGSERLVLLLKPVLSFNRSI